MRDTSGRRPAISKGVELFRKVLAASLLLTAGGGLCLAQRTPSGAQPADGQAAARPAGIGPDERAAQAKELDEPALRVLLRTQLAAFFWSGKSDEGARQAEALAAQALEDLHANKARVPQFYFDIFRRDLFALLERHSPADAKTLSERYESAERGGGDITAALDMLNRGQDVERAVEKARRGLNGNGGSVSVLVFFLSRLDQTRPELRTEAEVADSPSAKASLLNDAAHAALLKGTFVEAVDLALKIKSEGELHELWRDQFLRDVVVAALNKKDAEAAEYASERIVSAAERSGALQRLALHHHAAGDVARSWGFMNGALKLIDSLDDERRAVALLVTRRLPCFVLNAAIGKLLKRYASVRAAASRSASWLTCSTRAALSFSARSGR